MPRSIVVLLLGALASAGAFATDSQGKDWKSIAQLPDWSGVWDIDWRSFNGSSATGRPLRS